ncbi:SRPBCC family protein [Cellulomonas sp.]|uniref:SRPBCC family protein n=1 Tax=Cellulomonas sp. TaxID=40001 RepID=UPI001B248F32|nr:SRPBCC family protein [Cellulomonas sp.]MBO9553148.1 SRPBCC family protein [Cellulomonas sp.]
MSEVRVTRTLPIPADEAWALLTDVRHHERWIPFTRVETDGPPGLGTRIVAVSGPFARGGGRGLVDRMVVERYDPPGPGAAGVATFVKVGRVLRGSARIEVVAAGPTSSAVTWVEDVHLGGRLPRGLTAAVVGPFVRGMTAYALARVAAELRTS